nr:hypothetical protein [Elizabethkingia bruuniana]
MNKAILTAACLAAINIFGQKNDSLSTKSVDEVILTASRKKRI